MADPVVHITNGIPDSGTGNITTLGAVVTALSDGTQQAQGNVASGAADSGNPVKIGGRNNTTAPILTDGQRSDIQLDTRGNLKVTLMGKDTPNQATVGWNSNNVTLAVTGLAGSSLGYASNGGSADAIHNNMDTASLVTLTAAAAGTTNSADQTNYNGRGLQLVIDITAATAMTLTINIQGKDAASGKYYTILSSAALAAIGTTNLTVYPGATVAANVSNGQPLPRTWRVQTVVTGTSVTATLGASVIL